MSLNWAMLIPGQNEPVLLPGEHQHLFRQDAVKARLDCGGPSAQWDAKGKLYVSNQRIVFVADGENSKFQSLNIPLRSLRNWKLQQPWFAANYVTADLVPTPGGGLPCIGTLNLTFTEGGAIEFTTIYRRLLDNISADLTEALPAYEPPAYSG
ncbi:hypothetical protein BX666DRAFT_1859698 [Dichotomocladium elegans]|nr:hypothetical protein BX666DRAFT_1859698 [Dichotomocladium elegans]